MNNLSVKQQIAVVVSILLMLFAGGLFVQYTEANAAGNNVPKTQADCIPTEAWTETIVDVEAYDEIVFDYWQRYSWTGGPHESDDPPAFPSSDWQPNVQGDPHGVGVEGAYFRSHGNSGNGDWFYLEAVSKVVHHEAETHDVEHPAVTCEEEPTPTEPPTPTEEPNPDRPVRSQQCVGNDLVVTVEFPNGNIEHTSHVNAAQCSTVTEDTPEHSIGTPRRLDAPKVVVEEEGM